MTKLKRCPFCGTQPAVVAEGKLIAIECHEIGCGMASTPQRESLDAAAQAWNYRPRRRRPRSTLTGPSVALRDPATR